MRQLPNVSLQETGELWKLATLAAMMFARS